MKPAPAPSIDSIPNTTFFPFKQDNVSLLQPSKTDTFEICPPVVSVFPATRLENNHNLISNLIFTIIFLILFAFVRLRGKDLFYNLLNTLIKRKKSEILLTEGISSNLICYILSLGLSFSIIAIGITYLTQKNFINLFTFYIFGGLFLYHLTLLLLIRLLGWTFNAKTTANEVIVNLWTHNILLGLLLSPFIIAVFFVKSFAIIPLLKIVICGTILLLSVKIIRWIQILIAHRVLILYMILYLCALEIMPLLVLYKMVE